MIGEWIDFEDMILEVVSETEFSLYCRMKATSAQPNYELYETNI